MPRFEKPPAQDLNETVMMRNKALDAEEAERDAAIKRSQAEAAAQRAERRAAKEAQVRLKEARGAAAAAAKPVPVPPPARTEADPPPRSRSPKGVFPAGTAVEYLSQTRGQWGPAVVKAFNPATATYKLDVKGHAEAARVRLPLRSTAANGGSSPRPSSAGKVRARLGRM